MAIQVGAIEANLTANVSQFVSGMRSAQASMTATAGAIQSAGPKTAASMSQMKSAVDNVEAAVGKLRRTFQKTMGVIGAGFILPSIISKAHGAIFGFNQTLDGATIAMTSFIGTKAGAEDMLKTLQDFAAVTPFNFQDLLSTSQQMLAMGVTADELLPRLRAIGDAAAAMGGSPEVMQRIQRALGQIQAKGRVQAEELMQLAEVGIPAYQYIADVVGTTIPDALDRMKKGEIDAATAIKGILDGLGRDFGGMMEEQSKTMQGALSTVQDYVTMVVGKMGRPLFEAVRDLMLKIAKYLSSPQLQRGAENLAKNIANGLRSAGEMIGQFFKTIGPSIVSAIQTAYEFSRAFMRGLNEIKPMLIVVAGAVVLFAKSFEGVMRVMQPLLKLISGNSMAVAAFTAVIVTLIAKQKLLGQTSDGKAKSLQRMVDGFKAAKAQVVEQIRYQQSLARGYHGNISTMTALRAATVTGFRAMAVAAKSFIASILPMLALTLAITAAFKIFEAFTTKSRVAKERTNELTVALRDNTKAFLENAEAIAAGDKGAKVLEDTLLNTGDAATKIEGAFGALGKTKNLDDMLKLKDNFEETASAMLQAKGASKELADQLAHLINTTDDNGKTLINTIEMYGVDVPDSLKESVKGLEELQDQLENAKIDKMVDEQAKSMVGAGQITQEMADKAKNAAAAMHEEGTAAYYAAYSNNLLAAATEVVTTKQYAAYDAMLALGMSYDQITAAQDAAWMKTASAVEILDKLAAASKDGSVEMELFMQTVLGTDYALTQWKRAAESAVKGSRSLFESIAQGKKDMHSLELAGFDVRDSLYQLVYTGKQLGISQEEVQQSVALLVGQFISSAQAAGYSKTEIDNLIDSLNLLDRIDPTLNVKADVAEAQKQLGYLLHTMMMIEFMGGDTKGLAAQVAKQQALIAGLTTSFTKPKSGGGGGGSSIRQQRADFVKSLKDKSFAEGLVGSTPEQIADAIEQLITDSYKLGAKKLKNSKKAEALVRAVSQQLQGMATQLATLRTRLDEANQRISDTQQALDDLNQSYMDWQHSELGVGGPTAGENLAAGLDALDQLKTYLQDIQAEYASLHATESPFDTELGNLDALRSALDEATRARDSFTDSIYSSMTAMKFSANMPVMDQAREMLTQARNFRQVLLDMVGRGFPPSLIQQVMAAGLDAGTQLGQQLLSLPETDIQQIIDIQKSIAEMAQETANIAGGAVFSTDISNLQAAYEDQLALVDEMYQTRIEEAKAAIAAQQAVVRTLFETAIAEAGRNLSDAQQSAQMLTTAIADLEGAMTSLAGQIARTFGDLFAGRAISSSALTASAASTTTSAAPTYNITVTGTATSDGASLGAQIVELIKQYERVNGTRWRA